jgi:hypothetical protein
MGNRLKLSVFVLLLVIVIVIQARQIGNIKAELNIEKQRNFQITRHLELMQSENIGLQCRLSDIEALLSISRETMVKKGVKYVKIEGNWYSIGDNATIQGWKDTSSIVATDLAIKSFKK